VLLTLFVTAAANAETSATAPAEHAAKAPTIVVPPVPEQLQQGLAGNKVFLEGHGVGTQNYVCKPSGTGVAFVLFTPQATLFDDDGKQLITHFFSPNPDEANTDPTVVAERMIRVTWQDSQDSSSVFAKATQSATSATDPTFVAQGAVAWLLLETKGTQEGPDGGDRLTKTTFIQRLNTSGGLAPTTGCTSSLDLGNEAFVHYTANYFFYQKAD
jgi:hypothetical protein